MSFGSAGGGARVRPSEEQKRAGRERERERDHHNAAVQVQTYSRVCGSLITDFSPQQNLRPVTQLFTRMFDHSSRKLEKMETKKNEMYGNESAGVDVAGEAV